MLYGQFKGGKKEGVSSDLSRLWTARPDGVVWEEKRKEKNLADGLTFLSFDYIPDVFSPNVGTKYKCKVIEK